MAAISRGIDVSGHQGRQDWAALARGGLTFVQVKASEGEHSRDDRYRMHMDGIRTVSSLLPGAYHYAWPNQDPHAEADNYIGAVQRDADAHPAFVHWLDLEKGDRNYTGRTDGQIRAYAEAWIDRVKAAYPRQRVGCYTSGEDIKRGHYPRNSDALWYPAYPAGAMSYTQAQARARPAPSGVKALLWQFTSTPVDRSICYMTPAALRAWAGDEEDPMAGMTPAQIYAAVWRTDAVPAPADSPHDNPQWTAENALRDLMARVRDVQAREAAQSAAITALAGLAGAGVDTAAVVAAVREAIADAVVHVAVDVTGPPAADAAPAEPAPEPS